MLDFTIPTSKDDLLSDHTDRYVPRNIVGPDVVPRKYSECTAALRTDGYKFILEHFDSLASFIIHFQRLSWNDSLKGWNVIFKAVDSMVNELKVLLKGNHALNADVRLPAANATKMLVYIATQSIMAFEERVKKIGDSRIKKRGIGNVFAEQTEWQAELGMGASLLHELLLLPLVWLWDPPVPSTEESFFHLFGNMAFTVIENPAIVTAKLSAVKEAVLHMLGLMVKRYSYKISIVVRLADLLSQQEHCATVVAEMTALLQEQYGCHSAVREMAREVAEAHGGGGAGGNCVGGVGGDAAPIAARNHGLFLAEITDLVPHAVREELPHLLPLLQSPHVAVRNGVLCAVCSIILKCLSNHNLTVADKRQRDELLDILLDYVYDTNAFVRAKVVSLWRRLVEGGAVPLELRCEVMEAVGGRVLDGASSVRRAAIQVVTLFLEKTPALGERALEAQHLDEQRAILKEMHDRFREGNPREMKWLEMQPFVALELQEHFEEMNKEGEGEEEEEEETSNDEESGSGEMNEENPDALVEKVHKELCNALDKKDVVIAYKCVSKIKHLCPAQLSATQESDIRTKVDFYLNILGFFYKYESLTKETLTKSIAQVVLDKEEQEKITAQEVYVQYLEGSQAFMRQVRATLGHLDAFLKWSAGTGASGGASGDSAGAVADAVRLIRAAHAAGVPDAAACVRSVLQLLLHAPEAAVVEAVADGVKAVYFLDPVTEALPLRERPVASLVALLSELATSEAKALEVLVGQWLKAGDLPHGCVQLLWEVVVSPQRFPAPACPRRRRLLALALLRMAAPSVPERVRALAADVQRLLFEGAPAGGGDDAQKEDLEVAAAACAMLAATCPPPCHNHTAPVCIARLPSSHPMWASLAQLLARTFTHPGDHWATLATRAVDLAYALSSGPEPFVEQLLREMLNSLKQQRAGVLGDKVPQVPTSRVTRATRSTQHTQSTEATQATQGTEATQTTNANEEDAKQESAVPSQMPSVPARSLGRFLALAGHIAMMQMIFMDTAVYSKIKSMEENDKVKSKAQKKTRSKRKAKGASQTDDTSSPTSCVSSVSSSAMEGEAEESTQAEDRVSEHIRQVCEQEVFHSSYLLGQLLPLVQVVISKPKSFQSTALQRSAMLALAKMMMVSSTVCQNNIRLYVTVMGNSSDPETRAQAVIAIADITLRFPNIVEPWSKYVYARLQDNSELVRLNTIFILSRLVMCDMIKVRGQISDLALCICDGNPCIADASKAFFRELSQKHNVLYNVLPDIISGLCAADLPEEKFNEITSFVFGLIKKEKQVEVLVEKLCQRFHLASNDQQASDLAFCLTLLHYSTKALTRLMDQIALYSDKLHISKVYQHFQTIVKVHTKAGVKPEIKTAAEELSSAIENVLQVHANEEGEDVPMPLPRPLKTPKSLRGASKGKETPASTRATSRRKKARKVEWSSDEES